MGDNPFFHHHAAPQYLNQSQDFGQQARASTHLSHIEVDEEEYTIKCICGFTDDDGHTTLCEQCNTWQHVECFYWPALKVPEVHQCVDCQPRPVNPDAAATRQRLKRETTNNGTEERKAKRQSHKSHKKSKTRDHASLAHIQTNGFNPHDAKTEQTHADYTPPLKRHKSHHRQSHSVSDFPSEHQFHHHPSLPHETLSQSPFKATARHNQHTSPEFVNAYQDHDNFRLATNNEYNDYANIDVVSTLSRWLNDPANNDFLVPYPASILEQEPPVAKVVRQDQNPKSYRERVQLVATSHIPLNGLVGQVVGEIGSRDAYMADVTGENHWDRLRHPDHFVFFHPQIHDIVIDCRKRGSIMRFARRGCNYNVKVTTVITGEPSLNNAHFYLSATRDIMEGEEIILGWKPIDTYLTTCIGAINAGEATGGDMHKYVADWVDNLLAHFGGCACDSAHGAECHLRKYQNRPLPAPRELALAKPNIQRQRPQKSPAKVDGGFGTRADTQKIPVGNPITAHETDIRSERSSNSRNSKEPTPNECGDQPTPNGATPEPSEREKKKLQQQMRLMEKIDLDAQKAQNKKKRRSGSNPHTPTVPTPGREGSMESPESGGTVVLQRPPSSRAPTFGLNGGKKPSPNVKSPTRDVAVESPRSVSAQSSPSRTERPSNGSRPSRVRPKYIDAAVQTSPQSEAEQLSQPSNTGRRPFLPLSKRLLNRNHQRKAAAAMQQSQDVHASPATSTSPHLPPQQSIGAEPFAVEPNTRSPSEPQAAGNVKSVEASSGDVPMIDRDGSANDSNYAHPVEPRAADSSVQTAQALPSIDTFHQKPEALAELPSNRPVNEAASQRSSQMHVDLPPPRFPSSASSAGDGGFTMSPASQAVESPLMTNASMPFAAPVAPMSAPGVSPNASSMARPSLPKKKMSLSEYTSRNKGKTPGSQRSQSIGQSHAEALASVRQTSRQSDGSNFHETVKEEPDKPP